MTQFKMWRETSDKLIDSDVLEPIRSDRLEEARDRLQAITGIETLPEQVIKTMNDER